MIETLEILYELLKLIGIVSETEKVLYLFCALIPVNAGINKKQIKISSWPNFKCGIRFLIMKCKFKKGFYQVHIGSMERNGNRL
jgi:hypothetical protein